MLIEVCVFVECATDSSWANRATCSSVKLRIDQVDSDAQAWLSRVLLLLSLSLVLLSLRSHLVDCLLQQNFQFCLRPKLFVVLETSCLEQSALVLHHFPEFLHYPVVTKQFLFLGFNLASRHVNQGPALLV